MALTMILMMIVLEKNLKEGARREGRLVFAMRGALVVEVIQRFFRGKKVLEVSELVSLLPMLPGMVVLDLLGMVLTTTMLRLDVWPTLGRMKL